MDHAVIAYLVPAAEADWDVFDVEDQLIEAIDKAGVGEFDGNLMGPGEVELYAYGPDADALFEVMEPILRAVALQEGSYAVKRYGAADDPGAREERVELT
jgi:hypothetical protein